MSEFKFKSKIMCQNCVSKVKMVLDKNSDIENWAVDLEQEDRILTVNTTVLDEAAIKAEVLKAGFVLETL